MDLFVRDVEVLVRDAVDVFARELAALLLAIPRVVCAALAKALELADVRARDLGHVPELGIGEMPHVARRVEQAALGPDRALERRLVKAREDGVLHLKAGLGHQAEHAGVEAAGEALVHAELFGRAVRGDDDLLVVADELVHQPEEVVDARRLADDVLDIVDDEDVRRVVLAKDSASCRLLHGDLVDEVVDIGLRVRVLHADPGLLLLEFVLDGEQQVRFAQTRVAVDKERRAGAGFVCHGGKAQSASVGVLVLLAVDEVLKGEFRIRGGDRFGLLRLGVGGGGFRFCLGIFRRRGFGPGHLGDHFSELVGGHRVGDGYVRGRPGLRHGHLARLLDRLGYGFTGNMHAGLGRRRGPCRLRRCLGRSLSHVWDGHGECERAERDLLEVFLDELALLHDVRVGKARRCLNDEGVVGERDRP